jgi:hypothetical protein
MTTHPITLSKSDFLLYCDAPRHLWAKKHNQITQQSSPFAQLLGEQGYAVEELGKEYLQQVLLAANPGWQLLWQQTYTDGSFQSRVDGLIYKPESGSVDLVEIKSSTGVAKEHIYDVTFQALILACQFSLDHVYILHLNKDYTLSATLDPAQLFLLDDVSEKVESLKDDAEILRQGALEVSQAVSPDEIESCWSPKDCPCPDLCHPNLPEFSIFDIPRLSKPKKQELLDAGITAARDIPDSFGLNPKQKLVRERARTNSEHLNRSALRTELERLAYPLYFLDYETCNSAIPRYPGYHPQQQIVFQYSLHRLDRADGEPVHREHLSASCEEPSLSLLEQLSTDIGDHGTVVVWNKTFEMTRNKDMGLISPQYAGFLEVLNQRIYDLGEIINQGIYLHPGFKGSWSIKHLLPVMVPELSYADLAIHQGDQASIAWWQICFGQLPEDEKEKLKEALLCYCHLDTLAMVEIYKRLWLLAIG